MPDPLDEMVALPVGALRSLVQQSSCCRLIQMCTYRDRGPGAFRRCLRVTVVREIPDVVFRFEYLEDDHIRATVEYEAARLFDMMPRLASFLDRQGVLPQFNFDSL